MTFKKRAADVLRFVAIVAVHAAEELDPQPAVMGVWPFEVHTATGTTAHEARITWHMTG